MKCPHCLVAFHDTWQSTDLGGDKTHRWTVMRTTCAACGKYIIRLRFVSQYYQDGEFMAYPKGYARAPLSPEVPSEYAGDYQEACLVLTESPKASAALSRRCLQNILRNVAKVKPSDLSKEIDEILNTKQLPSHLAGAIDAIRNIGNFATHPLKSTNTGEIVDVEPGEAEWQLDVLEGLFDFYFVQPAQLKAKRDALNKKLTDAGKPPMK